MKYIPNKTENDPTVSVESGIRIIINVTCTVSTVCAQVLYMYGTFF